MKPLTKFKKDSSSPVKNDPGLFHRQELTGILMHPPYFVLDQFGFNLGISILKSENGRYYLISFPAYMGKLLRQYHSPEPKVICTLVNPLKQDNKDNDSELNLIQVHKLSLV